MGSDRLRRVNWETASDSLLERGFAELPSLLSDRECRAVVALYGRPELFRSRIDMARYRFGKGEYQYFRRPLPPLIEELRRDLYPRLAPAANRWAQLLATGDSFPATLDEFLCRCSGHGQTRPTPLLLRYGPGDFNCLHQDVYGSVAFPFQVVCFLSEPGRDYEGGEFLLLESAPRAQSMGRVLRPRQGDALAISTRWRPARGQRGAYKVNLRHGVSPVTSGERWTLGIIFHDAE